MDKYVNDGAYLPRLAAMLEQIEREQLPNIRRAAGFAYESMKSGGLLHVFSTGHSHMIVEELFYRTGGLAPINPLLSGEFMLHEGAMAATANERTPGKAEAFLSKFELNPSDTLLISSNSGINIVPIEAALYARRLGLRVIVVTSQRASKGLPPRHPSGLHLYELGDVVIDNCAPEGDGLCEIPESGLRTGGASTFGSLFIAQRLVLTIENLFIADGAKPPVFMSANIPGGDQYNADLIDTYGKRIPNLL